LTQFRDPPKTLDGMGFEPATGGQGYGIFLQKVCDVIVKCVPQVREYYYYKLVISITLQLIKK